MTNPVPNNFTFTPIGYFSSLAQHKLELPHQANAPGAQKGSIILNDHPDFELALRDLDGFSRIWVVFTFHENSSWKPLVRPPRLNPDHPRVGVFASRSPYRPNSIGISPVELLSIDGLTLHLGPCDLLHGTPILDLKPYIPPHDAFSEERIGWLENIGAQAYHLQASADFSTQNAWLLNRGGPNLLEPCHTQLSYNPTYKKHKRVQQNSTHWTLAYRTWRIDFAITASQQITLLRINSGYTLAELQTEDDPYNDKTIHREFSAQFLP